MLQIHILDADIKMSMTYLSDRYLPVQVLDAVKILNILENGKKPFSEHAKFIANNWRGYEGALRYYIDMGIEECYDRDIELGLNYYELEDEVVMPWWIWWDRLHRNHQTMLYRRDPFHYERYFDPDPEFDGYGYIKLNSKLEKNKNLHISKIAEAIKSRRTGESMPSMMCNTISCSAVVSSGKRKGNVCNKPIEVGNIYCGLHSKHLLRV